MTTQQLAKRMFLIGAVGIGVALLWWYVTFSAYPTNAGNDDFLSCIYSRSFTCRVAGMFAADGFPAYDPLLLWAAVVTIGVGLTLGRSD